MKRDDLIFDAKTILEAAGINDESRLDEDYIGFKIDQKRAKEIRDTYNRTPIIEPIWRQDYGLFDLTPVNRAEDRTISSCDCKFAKAVLPPIVSLSDPMGNVPDLGVAIRSSCGKYDFHYMTLEKLGLIDPDSIYSKFRYYTRISNSYYITPEVLKARAILILERPLDGYVLDNTDYASGTLVSGTTYEVRSGNVTYNAVKYQKGQTFVANSTSTFTGLGKVFLSNQKRRMTNTDEYPMSSTMAEVILMKLFTQDYGIEAGRVADIKNDSQGLRILR